MKEYTNEDIKNLFSNLCCSKCKNDFEKESIKVIEEHKDIIICNLRCNKCGKDFGDVIFSFNRKSKMHSPMDVIEGPSPISADDVIDAHNYIKKFM